MDPFIRDARQPTRRNLHGLKAEFKRNDRHFGVTAFPRYSTRLSDGTAFDSAICAIRLGVEKKGICDKAACTGLLKDSTGRPVLMSWTDEHFAWWRGWFFQRGVQSKIANVSVAGVYASPQAARRDVGAIFGARGFAALDQWSHVNSSTGGRDRPQTFEEVCAAIRAKAATG